MDHDMFVESWFLFKSLILVVDHTLELPPLFFNTWATQTQQYLCHPALWGPTHQQVKTTSFQEVVHAGKNIRGGLKEMPSSNVFTKLVIGRRWQWKFARIRHNKPSMHHLLWEMQTHGYIGGECLGIIHMSLFAESYMHVSWQQINVGLKV